MSEKTYVITATNHKGGCGKTSVVVNLAYELGQLGKSVLVIDLDQQGNASTHLSKINPSRLSCEITDLLIDGTPEKLVQAIKETNFPNVSLIAATQKLLEVAEENKMGHYHQHPLEVLSRIIAPLDGLYDYILIDTPPNLGVLTANALLASTHFIVPVEGGSPYSVAGLSGLLPFIQEMKQANPILKPLGILLSSYNDRQRADKIVKNSIVQMFSDKIPLIPIEIVQSTNVKFAALDHTSVTELDPNSNVSLCFKKLALWLQKNL